MGVTVDTRLFTADELLRLPDDGSRYELVQGELKRMSPAGYDHGEIAMNSGAHLKAYVRAHRLGKVFAAETGFLLSRNPDTVLGEVYIAEAGFILWRASDTVRVPDVSFVRAERVLDVAEFMPGPPDLSVEVMYSSDLASEVSFKTSQYLRAGTRAIVVVDPDKRIVYVHRAAGNDVHTTIVEDVLQVDGVVPGWKMPLGEIFDA